MLNFLCIGAQKCGTTWLYETLARHPQFAFPGGKEVHFWDHPGGHTVEWYLNLFSNDQQINGDITPAYAILGPDVIRNIYQALPHLKLVYLIRDPMERAWSSAKMALSRAEMIHDEASDQWFIDHFMSKGSRARGDYQTCLRHWLSVFPSNQLLIMHFDAIRRAPVQAANSIVRHLGANSFFDASDAVRLSGKVFSGSGHPIRPSLRPVLQDICRDQITFLEKHLQTSTEQPLVLTFQADWPESTCGRESH